MRILIACEESQAVTKEFRALGHDAYSCDIQECSGGHPEWHIQGDAIEVIGRGWDMMIAFPPCTDICVSGSRHFAKERENGKQQRGIDFFMAMINAPIDKIAVENPVGIMSSHYRVPSQIIQPYYFGDDARKTTCLWLKNLPNIEHKEHDDLFGKKTWIQPTIHVCSNGKTFSAWEYAISCRPVNERGKLRSKTFQGFARAMATQWG